MPGLRYAADFAGNVEKGNCIGTFDAFPEYKDRGLYYIEQVSLELRLQKLNQICDWDRVSYWSETAAISLTPVNYEIWNKSNLLGFFFFFFFFACHWWKCRRLSQVYHLPTNSNFDMIFKALKSLQSADVTVKYIPLARVKKKSDRYPETWEGQ